MSAPARPAIVFRPLARTDFPLLTRWLADPAVHRWWFHETEPEAIERDFAPTVDGDDPSQDWIALADDVPLGLVQFGRYADFPEYEEELQALLPVPPGAASIDYLVGDARHRGVGLGTAMIAAFVARVWAAEPDVTTLLVPVMEANRPSWRALERAGFRRVARGPLEPDNPVDAGDPTHVVLRLDRPRGPAATA